MGDESLASWMRALIAYVRSGEPDLTNRQMALLMLVYLTPGPHTVRGLAKVLGVSKPVVTRALNTLGTLGYLRRERDRPGRRVAPASHRTAAARLRTRPLRTFLSPDARNRPTRSSTHIEPTSRTLPWPGALSRCTTPNRSRRLLSRIRRCALRRPTMRRSSRSLSRRTRSAFSTTRLGGHGVMPAGTGGSATSGPKL
jgi:DNA-binding MarR family transcriptional regulator